MSADWRVQAACRGVDTHIFFSEIGQKDPYKEARSYCSRCEVRSECLAAAFREEPDVSMIYGMRAGLTPEERQALMRGRKRRRDIPTIGDIRPLGTVVPQRKVVQISTGENTHCEVCGRRLGVRTTRPIGASVCSKGCESQRDWVTRARVRAADAQELGFELGLPGDAA